MLAQKATSWFCAALAAAAVCAPAGAPAGQLNLGPQELVSTTGGPIAVPGYSVPSLVDWNADGRQDLLVGEGGAWETPAIRLYLNVGTASAPQFDTFTYVVADGTAITYNGPNCSSCLLGACLGLYPRFVDFDADGLKDLVVGQSDGTVGLYVNEGTAAAPVFGAGGLIQIGQPGSKADLYVGGGRATPNVVDWNADGKKDLIGGGLSGQIHVFLNEGTDAAPDFRAETRAQDAGGNLVVPSDRSSPHVFDANGDGRKDFLAGNTDGQLLLYLNENTDAAPIFSSPVMVEAGGAAIDLPGTPRSRPFVCDWTGDGLPDVLVGSGDGTVGLYQGVPEPTGLVLLGLAAGAVLRRRRP